MPTPTWTVRLANHASHLDADSFDTKGSWKRVCRAATTADITIATALNSGDTLDGVTLADGDRVLVKDQAAGAENGIYVVGASPARAEDFDEATEVAGAWVVIFQGTVNAGKVFRNTNTTVPTIGTTALTFSEFTGGGGGTLDSLTDVDTTGVSDQDVLAYDLGTTTWVPVAPGTPSIDWGETADITDQDFSDVADAGALNEVARADHLHGMPASPGGGGAFAPTVNAFYVTPFASTTSLASTITAAATGQRFIVAVSSYNRDCNTPTCTNVTFTEVLAVNFGGAFLSVYVGVVAGGSSGTTITTTATGADFIFVSIYEIDHALTPTVVDTATLAATDAAGQSRLLIGPVDCAIGDLFIMGYAVNNASNPVDITASSPMFQLAVDSAPGLKVGVGIAGSTKIVGWFNSPLNSAVDFASGIVVVS